MAWNCVCWVVGNVFDLTDWKLVPLIPTHIQFSCFHHNGVPRYLMMVLDLSHTLRGYQFSLGCSACCIFQ